MISFPMGELEWSYTMHDPYERSPDVVPSPAVLLAPAVVEKPKLQIRRYVAGFAFDHVLQRVAMIRKTKPAWQAGRHNGIGGKLEAGETPLNAMVREFQEETSVKTEFHQWHHFAQLDIRADVKVDKHEPASVDFFCTVLSQHQGWDLQTTTEEEVVFMPLDQITPAAYNLLPNICWLVPMALRHLQGETVRFAHIIEN